MTGWARRLAGRLSGLGDGLPAQFTGTLDTDERVLAVAELADGAGHAVATSRGLWLPDGSRADVSPPDQSPPDQSPPDQSVSDGPPPRRIGWHLVSKATWEGGWLAVVEAAEIDVVEGAVLLTDQPMRRFRLARPGAVPEAVHARVTGSIKSSHHRELPGGGAWVVQRRVAGQDGVVLQVRADAGTDERAVRALAEQVAEQVRRVRAAR